MLVSTKGRYALRMVIALAKLEAIKKGPVSLKDIAKVEDISVKYLEQLTRCLAKANIITSSRGKYGGYRLARSAKDIGAGEIIHAAEGSVAPVSCLADGATCPRQNICTTVAFWHGLDSVIEQYMSKFTLADFLTS